MTVTTPLPSQPPTGPVWGAPQQPNAPTPSGTAREAAPAALPQSPSRGTRKRTGFVLMAVAVALVVGAGVLWVAPWKQKQVDFPRTIGPLTRVSWSPPMAWGGAENRVYRVLPGGTSWLAYADATEEFSTFTRPVYVIAAAFDSRNPAVTVNDLLTAMQGSGLLQLSLSEVHPVSGNPGATWDVAQCGQQNGELPVDPPHVTNHVPYTQIVVCAWADSEIAGVILFLNRDLSGSEDLLRMIQATATVVRD